MAQFFAIHPDNPQERLIKQAADIVRSGGVIVYPTDSCYALGCKLGDKAAMERILAIRKIDLKHHLTLMCADLSELGTYAKVDNAQFLQQAQGDGIVGHAQAYGFAFRVQRAVRDFFGRL